MKKVMSEDPSNSYEILQLLKRAEKIAKIGHWRWDIQKGALFWSDEIYKIHGVSKEDFTPDLESGINFYHPEDRPKVEACINDAVEKGESFEFDLRLITADKKIKHVKSYGECNFGQQGEVTAVFGIFQDITEAKRKEDELKNSKQFLKTIMDTIPDFIFVKDEEFKVTMANDAFLDMYEDRDKVIGYTTYENFPEDQVKKFTEQDRLALWEGHTETYEEITSLQKGHTKTFHTKKVGFKDAKGQHFLLGIARDVTELINIQKKLEDSEERFDLAMKASLSGIWDWGIATNKLFWSDRFKEILGIMDKDFEASYSEFERRIHPDDREVTLNCLQAHLESGVPYDVEYRFKREDETYVWVHVRGQAQWDRESKPVRMIGTFTDISERIDYQNQIQEYMKALLASNQELDDFAYIASHDLKEPLRGINNYAQILIEDYGDKIDEAGQHKLKSLSRLIQRIEGLLNSLLDFSRVGRVELAYQQINLKQILDNVLETLRMRLEQENVRVALQDNLPEIFCDHIRIGEVFANLITNAIKYNDKEDKKIEIGVIYDHPKAQGQITFFVKDNGIGIKTEYKDKVFDIFKRLHPQEAYGGGTGSGLTIVKKVIERHNGQIWVESTEGEGATFLFTLPQDVEAQEAVVVNG